MWNLVVASATAFGVMFLAELGDKTQLLALVLAAKFRKPIPIILGILAMAFATINVVGGFLVTDRMLEMFKKKPVAKR